jgi:hypothetical protein
MWEVFGKGKPKEKLPNLHSAQWHHANMTMACEKMILGKR